MAVYIKKTIFFDAEFTYQLNIFDKVEDACFCFATSVFILYLIILRYVKQEDGVFFCKQFYILKIRTTDQT